MLQCLALKDVMAIIAICGIRAERDDKIPALLGLVGVRHEGNRAPRPAALPTENRRLGEQLFVSLACGNRCGNTSCKPIACRKLNGRKDLRSANLCCQLSKPLPSAARPPLLSHTRDPICKSRASISTVPATHSTPSATQVKTHAGPRLHAPPIRDGCRFP